MGWFCGPSTDANMTADAGDVEAGEVGIKERPMVCFVNVESVNRILTSPRLDALESSCVT